MKIVYFVHCFFPDHFYGSETYTLNIATYMQQAGHDVHVVTAKFPGEDMSESLVDKYEYHGLQVSCFDKNRLPNARIKDTYYQEGMREHLKTILTELKPDIVHVIHLINHTAVLLEVLRDLKVPVIATFTDFFGFCFNNKLQAADGSLCTGPNTARDNCLACFLKATSNQHRSPLMKKATSTVPWVNTMAMLLGRVSQCFPKAISGKYRGIIPDLKYRPDILHACYQAYWAAIAPSKFLEKAYLHNGFNKPLYLQNFGVDIDRSPKPVRTDEPLRIGYIGQLAPHKGVDILLNAFRHIENSELHIYGPKDQDKSYSEGLHKSADHCISEVLFHGTFAPEKMAIIMRELDFIVIPSTWYENSPLVLLYALATHTPTIVSDVEGMTEFVNDGENGFVFPIGDIKSLSDILNSLCDDPVSARKICLYTNYPRTTKDMAEEVLKLYGTMLVE